MLIIEDTREKFPWNFEFYGAEQIRRALKTGDYTISGYENEISLDRKMSLGELYRNMFNYEVRFEKEMKRMAGMDAYIICEFPYTEISRFPASLPKRVQAGIVHCPKDIVERINYLTNRYDVEFMFCNDRHTAEETAFDILKDFYENHRQSE